MQRLQIAMLLVSLIPWVAIFGCKPKGPVPSSPSTGPAPTESGRVDSSPKAAAPFQSPESAREELDRPHPVVPPAETQSKRQPPDTDSEKGGDSGSVTFSDMPFEIPQL